MRTNFSRVVACHFFRSGSKFCFAVFRHLWRARILTLYFFKKDSTTCLRTVALGSPVISLCVTLALDHNQLKSTQYPLDLASLNLVKRIEWSFLCFNPFLIFNSFLWASTAAAIIFALLFIHLETKDWLIQYLLAISSWVNPPASTSWMTLALNWTEYCSRLFAPLCLLLVLPLDGAAILI